MLESVESQIKMERRSRIETDTQLKEMETRRNEAQLKSQQIISALKTQVAEQTQARVSIMSFQVQLYSSRIQRFTFANKVGRRLCFRPCLCVCLSVCEQLPDHNFNCGVMKLAGINCYGNM